MLITAEELYDGIHLHRHPVLLVEDGMVASVSTRDSVDFSSHDHVLDFGNATLCPAFFDIHFHGAAGHDVMEATSEALSMIGTFLASRGVGAYLPTTVTAPLDVTLRAVNALAKEIARPPMEGQARPVGIHLEGPFLSPSKRGVHPENLLLAPDVAVFDRLFEAGEGHIRLMTIAPELPGAVELTAHAVSRGVRVSVGHSNATANETHAVIAAGATSATHTFNAMRPLNHREPGILGTVLTEDALFAELICDGVHTAPEMARLWWRAKGVERAILMTDAMSACGMPDGEYQLGGFSVQVSQGRAMAGGVLAGSVLTMDRALSKFIAFTGATVAQGARLLTANPAAMTGIADGVGSVGVGQPANFVALGPEGQLIGSFLRGKRIS